MPVTKVPTGNEYLWSRDLIQYNSSKKFENIVVIAA